uniref:Neur_chan_LBD domain-containing protein n=1 Tax=Heterorhabditis bacteriophora TaxID=37862 RepID=A0A1I7WBQ2_HETBA
MLMLASHYYPRSRIEKTVIDDTIYDFRLAIELRWDEWSSCTGNVPTQRREAHCYIVEDSFGPPAEAPIEEHLWLDEVKWMGKIGKLVRTDAFRKRGIRLHRHVS